MLIDLIKTRVSVVFSKVTVGVLFVKMNIVTPFVKTRKQITFIKVPGLLYVTLDVNSILLFDSGDHILFDDGSRLRVN